MLGEGKEIAAASASALCCERCGWKCVLSVPGAAVFGILEGNCVYRATHWVWGNLHVERPGSSICVTVRGLERVIGLFVFTCAKARVLGEGQEIAAASGSALCERSICVAVRGLGRVSGLFVFTFTKARVLGEGQEIAAASVRALCCERCSWKCVRSVPGAAVLGTLEGNCVYDAPHWVWG